MITLVTGASEPLGLALACRLIGEGRPVRLLARRPHRVEAALGPLPRPGLDVVEWHPISEPAPSGVLAGVATLVHLEDEGSAWRAGRGTVDRVRCLARLGIERLAAAGDKGHLRRIVVRSSVAIYADEPGEIYTETSALPVPASPLQKAAAEAEAAAATLGSQGAAVAVARFGLIVGIPGVLDQVRGDLGRALMPPLADRQIPAIHVDDAVALLVGLIDNPHIIGPINAVAPAMLEGRTLAAVLGADRSRLRLPMPESWMLRRYGDEAELLLRRSQIAPRRLIEEGCAFTHSDVLPALSVLVPASTAQSDAAGGPALARLRRLIPRRRQPSSGAP